MPTAKTIIRRDFPRVSKIIDSKETLNITVLPQDASTGRKKDPENCALARACIRQKIAEAAIIGLAYSYLIKGNTAIRFKTSAAVSREITSFDRHQDFAPGHNYKLSRVSPGARLGKRNNPHHGREGTPTKSNPVVHKAPVLVSPPIHHTDNVRVMRRAKAAVGL